MLENTLFSADGIPDLEDLDMENDKKAIIIGAGPAGLTAGYELVSRTSITPTIFEATADIGGISKTVNFKGNRIDIGGHRFFSKSDIVMQWWQSLLPLQGAPSKDDAMLGREVVISKEKNAPDPEKTDEVMLVRRRLSRIFFLRKFFDYPVSLNLKTILNLGIARIGRIGFSYTSSRLFPIRKETSLEDFFINRFGRELYRTFFKDYTEKVWGVPCTEIKPEWGAQRIKGLSISKAIIHALKQIFVKPNSLEQKKIETSLIEQFMYPKLGPGQMWETVAEEIQQRRGEIAMEHTVTMLESNGNRILSAIVQDKNGNRKKINGDFFFSTMPVRDLIRAMGDKVPPEVKNIAEGLSYRNFITVGLLLTELKIKNGTDFKTINQIIPDNWIYVQESDVKLGRIQIFNNWSPYLVKDPNKVWIGLEYFCNEGDSLWTKSDDEMAELAIEELIKIGMIEKKHVLDHVTIRMPNTYPGYFGTYEHFDQIRNFTDQYENLFLIGRNGMHRYNNQDHSMLTAMAAVENIIHGVKSKENIWNVNVEDDYHEEK